MILTNTIRFMAVCATVILCLSVIAPAADGKDLPPRGLPYDGEVVYPGKYESKGLYLRRSETRPFTRSQKPQELTRVYCGDAKAPLQIHGLWTGNLTPDGYCAPPGDDAQWAVGNYLNYQSYQRGSQ